MNFVNNFSSTIVSERLPGDVDAGVSPPFGRAGVGIPLLRQYWRIAVRRKWVIAGVIAASFMLGLIITLLMTPLYTATATMEIARQGENIVDIDGADVGSRPAAADLEFYQTQYYLLEPRSLAERVAADDRKSTRLNSSKYCPSRMPSSA